MGIANTLAESKDVYESGVYLQPGTRARVKLKKVKEIVSKKDHGEKLVVEAEIVESDNPAHPSGQRVSQVFSASNRAAMNDGNLFVRKIIARLNGTSDYMSHDPSKEEIEELLEDDGAVAADLEAQVEAYAQRISKPSRLDAEGNLITHFTKVVWTFPKEGA